MVEYCKDCLVLQCIYKLSAISFTVNKEQKRKRKEKIPFMYIQEIINLIRKGYSSVSGSSPFVVLHNNKGKNWLDQTISFW